MAATAYASELVDAAIERAVTEAGLEKLKAEQVQVIHQFVSGKDVFVSLPTGYGKSLCNACYRWCLTRCAQETVAGL